MKRIYLSLVLLVLVFSTYAQHNSSIHIVGEAKKMVMPDVAIFELRLSATEKSETESFKKLTDLSQEVLKRLIADGYTEQQIKLTDFSVDKNENILKTKEKKITYTASQSLIIKFAVDKKRILDTYSHLTANEIKGLTISSSTECSDTLKNRIQKELIIMALKDAKEKADIIAKTTGYAINAVEQIGYKTDYDNNVNGRMEINKFASPKMVRDVELQDDSNQTSLSYFSINELEFNESIKISYSMMKGE